MTQDQPAADTLDGDFAALRGAHGVQVLTDDGREDILATARLVAARLAAALDTTLYLVDRSARTWTETPPVQGPAGIDELRSLGIDHVVRQIEAANELSVTDVRGLAPSIPNFDFLTDGLHATGAEVVVASTGLDHPRILDRLQGSDDVFDKVRDRIGDRHLVLVESDGSFRLG